MPAMPRKYALGIKGKTSAALPEGKGKAIGRARRRARRLEGMEKKELLALLKGKRYALDATQRLGISLENLSDRNLRQIAMDHLLRAQHRLAGGSSHFYRKMGKRKLQELRAVIKQLKAAGVRCEEIEQVSRKGIIYETEMKNLGRSIIQVKKTEKMLGEVASLLGKMHAAGIKHGHPHQGNIVVNRKGRLAIIDLMEAERLETTWGDPQAIFLGFLEDYKRVYDSLKRQIGKEAELKMFFEKIVSEYPAKPETKAAVVNAIDNFLIYRIR